MTSALASMTSLSAENVSPGCTSSIQTAADHTSTKQGQERKRRLSVAFGGGPIAGRRQCGMYVDRAWGGGGWGVLTGHSN